MQQKEEEGDDGFLLSVYSVCNFLVLLMRMVGKTEKNINRFQYSPVFSPLFLCVCVLAPVCVCLSSFFLGRLT